MQAIMSEKIKLYFLGSGDIAVPVLQQLSRADEVLLQGIGTQIDRPAGRNCALMPTPVGKAAANMSLPVHKIPNVNDAQFINHLRSLDLDFIVVISFGQLLKEEILKLPRYGCINVHASLLPKYRGASPITQALLHQDAETGNTFMDMEKGLDSGAVYHTQRVPLSRIEYSDELEHFLGELAARDTVKVLQKIISGELVKVPQDHSKATVCRKIKKHDGKISFETMTADQIEAAVRAFYPWPGAFFEVSDHGNVSKLTITKAKVRTDLEGAPGETIAGGKSDWIIGCKQHALEIIRLSAPGKREMSVADYLNGRRGQKPLILKDFHGENQ